MPLVPKHIKALSPYKSGQPLSQISREYGLSRIVKMDSNENPLGPSPKAIVAVRDGLAGCHRYPDSNGYELRAKLAGRFNLKLDNVILGAGSEGIMSTIMRTFLSTDDEIVGVLNSFIGFKVLANASGIRTNWVPMTNYRYDLAAVSNAINEYTKIIYLANPDNPTGTYFTVAEFDTFMATVPKRALVLLDEAYFEYAHGLDDYPDSMHYRYDNVITLRTFSKVYGLAGFRIGYGFAHDNLIGNLLKVKLPFEPSVPAQIAALAALEDVSYLDRSLTSNQQEKSLLETCFSELGLQYLPSATNFITLVFSGASEARELTLNLLHKGIVLRHLERFGHPQCVRITIGTPDENRLLVEGLNSIMKKGS